MNENSTSPYINRFLQPDTIIPDLSNPQSWNRYSYVTNRPVNFTDPSGHDSVCGSSNSDPECPEEPPAPIPPIPPPGGGGGGCNEDDDACWMGQSADRAVTVTNPDFSGYTTWEIKVLKNVMNSGSTGYAAVMYILNNNVDLIFDTMISGNGAQWRIVNGQQFIVLNSDLYSENSSVSDSFMLQNIAHEAKHLEQGPKVALSVYGEQEGWQTGIQVFIDLGYEQELNPWSRKLHDLPFNYNPFNLWVADFYMQMRGGIGYPI